MQPDTLSLPPGDISKGISVAGGDNDDAEGAEVTGRDAAVSLYCKRTSSLIYNDKSCIKTDELSIKNGDFVSKLTGLRHACALLAYPRLDSHRIDSVVPPALPVVSCAAPCGAVRGRGALRAASLGLSRNHTINPITMRFTGWP